MQPAIDFYVNELLGPDKKEKSPHLKAIILFVHPLMSLQLYLPAALFVACLLLIWKEKRRIVTKGERQLSTLITLGLPNPEPLVNFDLETATTRNVSTPIIYQKIN